MSNELHIRWGLVVPLGTIGADYFGCEASLAVPKHDEKVIPVDLRGAASDHSRFVIALPLESAEVALESNRQTRTLAIDVAKRSEVRGSLRANTDGVDRSSMESTRRHPYLLGPG